MDLKRMVIMVGVNIVFILCMLVVFFKVINAIKADDLKYYSISIDKVIKQKDGVIRDLYNRLMIEDKENQDMKNTLSNTRNALESLSNKFIQPSAGPVAVLPAVHVAR